MVLVGGAIGDETGEVCCRCCDDEDVVDDDDDDEEEEEEEEEEEVMASISLVIARIATGPGLDGRYASGVDAAREEEDCCCHSLIMSACQSSNRMSGLKSSTGLSRVERSAGEDRGVVVASVALVRADPAVPGGENATTPLDASRNGSAATENRAMIPERRIRRVSIDRNANRRDVIR